MPAFSSLPTPVQPADRTGALSTVDLLLDGLTRLAERCPPGLFVVSSEDSFVHVGDRFCERFSSVAQRANASGVGAATAVAMALPVCEVARQHGAYHLGAGGEVRRLLYRAPEEELVPLVATPSSCVPKVCGVVFFDEVAATRLLHVALDPLFEACSYLGIDNGAHPLGFSLYLDLLACLGQDVSAEEFAQSVGLTGQVYVDKDLRAQLWRLLHGQIHLSAVVTEPDDPAQYMYVRSTQDFVKLVASLQDDQSSGTQESKVHASASVVNSVLRECSVAGAAVIESSFLQRCNIGEGAVCSGLKRIVGLDVPPGLRLQQVSLLGSGYEAVRHGLVCVAAYRLEDERCQFAAGGTFLGQSWEEFFRNTGAGPADLWGEGHETCARTLRAARLFPTVADLSPGSLGLLWAEYAAAIQQTPPASRRARVDLWRRRWMQVWRDAPRLSLEELLSSADVGRELEWQDEVSAETNVLRARQLMLHQRDKSLRHIIDDEVRRRRWGLLDVFDAIAAAEDTPLDVAARSLAQVAELLAAFGGVAGGLRSGMARNPHWRGALARLSGASAEDRREAVLEMRRLRSQWINDGPVALIRAARHYEAAAQLLILTAVATCSEFVSISPAAEPTPPGAWVTVEAPARIDLAGGWTDTPPVCYAHGGAVVNLAVTVAGRRPLGARAQRLSDRLELVFETRADGPGGGGGSPEAASPPTVVCRTLADLEDYNRPGAPGSLVKCCALSCGIVALAPGSAPLAEQLRAAGGGLHLVTWSSLPQGSGLGGSSVLAGVAMKAILAAFGLDMDDSSLIHAVQNVEQMLTTGGGWQDQVGAILGGAKITRSAAALPLRVVPEPLPMSQELADAISRRLVLVFTGRPRLAKNLLQNVIRQWFAQTPEITRTVRELVANAEAAADAIRAGDLEKLGACLSAYWAQKRVMAPGSEPHAIAGLREALSPGLLGFTLAGAGGGGFAVLLTREPLAHEWVRSALAECPGMEAAYVCEAAVDFEGLRAC